MFVSADVCACGLNIVDPSEGQKAISERSALEETSPLSPINPSAYSILAIMCAAYQNDLFMKRITVKSLKQPTFSFLFLLSNSSIICNVITWAF